MDVFLLCISNLFLNRMPERVVCNNTIMTAYSILTIFMEIEKAKNTLTCIVWPQYEMQVD